ncbi:uncharacterized protein LOC134298345 [Anolis carolinensis]|uniref:uncharacterized protein LOC134298345 n=1 Tax=Anolis carolinensis TaxID=28377 RepID=UPI002F2B78F4
MPPKKNVGGPKGKGPAKKIPAKRPPPPSGPSTEDEDSAQLLGVLVARIEALEREKAAAAAAEAQKAGGGSNTGLIRSLFSRISALEGERSAAVPVADASLVTSTPVTAEAVPSTSAAAAEMRSAVSALGKGDTHTFPWGVADSQDLITTQARDEPVPSTSGTQLAIVAPVVETPSVVVASLDSTPTIENSLCFWGTADWPLPASDSLSATALGSHLAQKTIDKILRNEYIDIFTLYFRELDKKEKDDLDDERKEIMKKRKVDQNWGNWFSCFLIYGGVLVKAYPSRAHSLFQYMNIINSAYVNFTGSAWLLYDKRFRLRAAHSPTLRWDLIDHQLWLEVLTPARPIAGEKADSGHTIQNSRAGQSFRQHPYSQYQQPQQSQQRLLCWEYSSQGVCSRRGCKFQHVCAICSGQHSSKFCSKGKPGKGGGKSNHDPRRGFGSGGFSKGAQPN